MERSWSCLDDIVPSLRRFLAERAEPWLQANPAHYGLWLSHCRARRAVDDHPLFMDYAPDARAQKWPEL